jgi:glycosyltransferase involved in cell wall biosynthesis
MPAEPAIRVGVVQIIIPHYRVPLFDRIGRTSGIELTVWSDSRPRAGSLQAAPPTTAFRMEAAPARFVGPFLWQPGMMEAARSGVEVLVLPWNARAVHLRRALRCARRAGVRTILWGHGTSKRENTLRRWLRRRLLRDADGVLLYGDHAARRLIQDGWPPEHVFVAHNAIDQQPILQARSSWRQRPAELLEFQRQAGLVDRQVIIFISRLEPENRLHLLLEALVMVRRSCPQAMAVIIGEGPDRAALERLSQSLRLEDALIFTGAVYEEMRIAPWALSARLCAYPVNIGLSLLHAFGYGLPVITSNRLSAQNPEIEALRDGVNGLLYEHGSAADLAARITALLRDEARRSAMSQAALDTVSGPQGYTLERMVEEFVAAIRAVGGRERLSD